MLIEFSPIQNLFLCDEIAESLTPANGSEEETDTQRLARISLRFDAMERLALRAVAGEVKSLIISGPPGLGKSYTLEMALKQSKRKRIDFELTEYDEENGPYDATQWYDRITGGCTATGLYHAFWNMRDGGLVVIDDCDSVFEDTEALNLIKLATDSGKERQLSWRKRASWLDQYAIPRSFEFKGCVVFLTNIDFEIEIQRHNKATEHFKALIDRADYLCLTLRTQRDFLIRIHAVSDGPSGMLQRICGLTAEQAKTVLDFIEQHVNRFYNLSLRLVNDIADKILHNPTSWQADVEATKMKTK